MDDLTFSARRATVTRPEGESELELRFKNLVQSPLRAGILRYLSARPDEGFDVDALMQTFGRLRLDVENCIRELAAFGVARAIPGTPVRYAAARMENPAIERLLDRFLERRATISTEDQSPSVQRFREMIGRDEKMLIVFEWIRTAAKSDISVLILGPTGSGKELVARMIHELSRRQSAKFQAVNCAALPDTLFESEIFGYEKGAFTGAHDRKPGRLELANEGTLFLDEIGDLSIIAQAKLLRVLEERRFERLGGNKSIHVDFRLISATNRPLGSVRARQPVPRGPLLSRQRVLDPPAVAARAPGGHSGAGQAVPRTLLRIERPAARRQGFRPRGRRPAPGLSLAGQHPRAREHGRPELPCRRQDGRSGRPTSSSSTQQNRRPRERGERLPSLREAERGHIVRILEACNWNKKEAARILEISRGTLYRKILEFGLEPQAHGAARHRQRRLVPG